MVQKMKTPRRTGRGRALHAMDSFVVTSRFPSRAGGAERTSVREGSPAHCTPGDIAGCRAPLPRWLAGGLLYATRVSSSCRLAGMCPPPLMRCGRLVEGRQPAMLTKVPARAPMVIVLVVEDVLPRQRRLFFIANSISDPQCRSDGPGLSRTPDTRYTYT